MSTKVDSYVASAKPKYENPSVIVSVDLLNAAFEVQRRGCPVVGCKKPIVSNSTSVNGSAAKVTFVCKKGHPTTWTSCEQLGRQSLLLNRLVPAAAVMTGLKLAPTKRFLGLLQVDSHDAHYMKASSLDLLMCLTQQLYDEEVKRVQQEMMEDEYFDLGMCSFFGFVYLVVLFSTLYIWLFFFPRFFHLPC